MNLLLPLIIALMAVPAMAETIGDTSLFGQLKKSISSAIAKAGPCRQCQAMEDLRQRTFIPAQKDVRRAGDAKRALTAVYAQANRIMDEIHEESGNRSPHLANEIDSFYLLAADAIQFDQGDDIAHAIAYLNVHLESREPYNKLLGDERMKSSEAACRVEFLTNVISNKECNILNEIEEEEAAEATPKRRPKLKQCGEYNGSVSACEARRVSAKLVK